MRRFDNPLLRCFEHFVAARVQGGGDLAVELTEALLRGGGPLVESALKASGIQRNLLMNQHWDEERDEFASKVAQVKSAVAAGTTLDSTWAEPLVAQQALMSALFESLANVGMLDSILQFAKPLPSNVRFAITTAAGTGDSTVEAHGIPLTKQSFTGGVAARLKSRALVVFSGDLMRFGVTSQADALINANLRAAVATTADQVVAAKLLTGISPIASTGNARVDLDAALDAVSVGQQSKLQIYTSPRVVKQLAMLGTDAGPCFPDLTVPNGGSISGMSVMGIDVLQDYPALGDLLLVVDASRCGGDAGVGNLTVSSDGTVVMVDDGVSPVAHDVTSLFQSNSIALLLSRYFALEVAAGAVAAVSNADYSLGSP